VVAGGHDLISKRKNFDVLRLLRMTPEANAQHRIIYQCENMKSTEIRDINNIARMPQIV
jgi:hypothetical protein